MASSLHTIHVDPTGSDSAAGSASAPLRSLQASLEAHRRHSARNGPMPTEIVLRQGTYVLAEPLIVTEADASPENPLRIRSAGGKAVLTSTHAVTGWQPASHPGIPQGLAGNVWQADLRSVRGYRGDFRVLFDGERMLPRARSRGFCPELPCNGARKFLDRSTLHLPEDLVKPFGAPGSPELVARPHQSWLVNYLDLEVMTLDPAARTVRTRVPATYRLDPIGNLPDEPSCWIENLLVFLSPERPWVLDRETGTLYLYSADDPAARDIRFPALPELIRIQGCVGERANHGSPVRGVFLEGIVLTGTDRDVWGADDRGIQHDWDMYDKGNAMVRFRGAEDCGIRNCELRNGGSGGVRIDLHARNVTVEESELRDLGGTGVLLCGYGPGRKDVNRGNRVCNNHITRVGQLYWHAPGIFLWQSGSNQIRNNHIHDLPYNGLVVSGVRPRFFRVREPVEWGTTFVLPDDVREYRDLIQWDEVGEIHSRDDALKYAFATDNLIQDNEIHDVMKTLGDGNAIYLSAAGRGTRVRRNLLYDCPRVCSEIRFDDDQEDAVVEENIVIGNGIKLKHRNAIINNIIIGGGIIFFRTAAPESRVNCNLVYSVYTPGFLYSDNLDLVAAIGPDRNCFFSPEPEIARQALERVQEAGADRHSILADPLFEDLEHGDLRLRDDSPARALGFQPIDVAAIGLEHSPAVTRLGRIVSLAKRPAHYFVQ